MSRRRQDMDARTALADRIREILIEHPELQECSTSAEMVQGLVSLTGEGTTLIFAALTAGDGTHWERTYFPNTNRVKRIVLQPETEDKPRGNGGVQTEQVTSVTANLSPDSTLLDYESSIAELNQRLSQAFAALQADIAKYKIIAERAQEGERRAQEEHRQALDAASKIQEEYDTYKRAVEKVAVREYMVSIRSTRINSTIGGSDFLEFSTKPFGLSLEDFMALKGKQIKLVIEEPQQ